MAEAPIDWSVTTFEGARREQYRRWRQMPLEDIIRSLEEMEQMNREWAISDSDSDA